MQTIRTGLTSNPTKLYELNDNISVWKRVGVNWIKRQMGSPGVVSKNASVTFNIKQCLA